MIKKLKYLLTLFVIGLGIINFSSANCDVSQGNVSGGFASGIHAVGGFYNSTMGNNTQYEHGVFEKGNVFSKLSTDEKKVFAVGSTWLFWFTESGLPYLYMKNGNNVDQGYFQYMLYCPEITSSTSSTLTDCTSLEVDLNEISNFLSTVTDDDYWGYYLYVNDYFNLGISSHALGKSLFFIYAPSSWLNCPLNNSEGYENLSFADIPNSILFDSPGFNGGGEGGEGGETENQIPGISPGSDESAINYFEKRYGRNESICYVGIDNITTMYGSSVSFDQGTGLNIFEVYSGLYNNSDLDKVYVWLNTWLINYEQWFLRDSPLYLASYNSGTNRINLYYDNLTFPFANNPVALYFMASNITDYSEGSTMGSEVVSYCNIKINGGTFDEIIDNSTKNNIINYTEQSNKNDGLNPDGTSNVIIYNNFDSYTGDAWLSSGVDIAFSGNTSLQNTLKNFFDRFDNAFDNINLVTTNRILPSYLVTAFLFVVLFKFLRKRK